MRKIPLYPSSRHIWRYCPSSAVLRSSKKEDTVYAKEGKELHAIMSALITKILSIDDIVTNNVVFLSGMGIHLTQSYVDNIKFCFDFLDSNNFIEGGFSEISINQEFAGVDFRGKIDVLFKKENQAVVIDFKFGAVPIEANCDQGELYAYMLFNKYDMESVKFIVLQPSAYAGELIKEHIYLKSDFSSSKLKIEEEALSVNLITKDTVYENMVVGSHCKMCQFASQCKKLQTEAHDFISGFNSQSELVNASNEDLANVYFKFDIFSVTERLVKEELLSRLKLGQQVPGLCLGSGRQSTQWLLDDNQTCLAFKKLNIPKDLWYTKKIITFSQLQKLSWEDKNGNNKTLSPTQIKNIETNYVLKKLGPPTIKVKKENEPNEYIEEVEAMMKGNNE